MTYQEAITAFENSRESLFGSPAIVVRVNKTEYLIDKAIVDTYSDSDTVSDDAIQVYGWYVNPHPRAKKGYHWFNLKNAVLVTDK